MAPARVVALSMLLAAAARAQVAVNDCHASKEDPTSACFTGGESEAVSLIQMKAVQEAAPVLHRAAGNSSKAELVEGKGGAPCASVGVSSFSACSSKCGGSYSVSSSNGAITCTCGGGWSCGGSGGGGGGWGEAPSPPEESSPSPPSPPAPPPAAGSAAEQWVKAHNKYRCMHDVPLVTWSPTIAAGAQSYAASVNGQMTHSSTDLGENLAWASPKAPSPEKSVKMWYDEINDTNGGLVSNSEAGTAGHYTQVVWKASTEIGCGTYKQLTICRYKPAGNFGGEYEKNVNAPVKSEGECAQ